MPNQYVNKVVQGDETIIDISDTTATADDVASGKVFYAADGTRTQGTASGGGGTIVSKTITANGTYNAASDNADGYSPVVVNVPSGGGGGSMADLIRFFDYDGTLVASYTSVPSSLPANPSHSGLVAQGWNYTLAQIQTQFAAMGTCDVGQMYVTESGDTEIDIVLEDGRLSPYLGLAPNGTVVIDWGDGSSSTVTGTSLTSQTRTLHAYAAAGAYTIKVHVSSGTVALCGTSAYTLLNKNSSTVSVNRVYATAVRAIRVGSNTTLSNYACVHCTNLTSVTIPSTVTAIGTCAFNNCYSLSSVTLPTGMTSISSQAFNNCSSLSSVTLPAGVTSIGSQAFYSCSSLPSVTLPAGVTSIDIQAFNNCSSLSSVTLPVGMTSTGNYSFYNCYSLSSVTLPAGVTSIGYYAFYNCYALSSVTLPTRVTSIGAQAFQNCYGLGEIHFKRATPPTVSNSNAWTNIPTDCIIYVPSGSLSSYTSASNYPSSSTYTYVEE